MKKVVLFVLVLSFFHAVFPVCNNNLSGHVNPRKFRGKKTNVYPCATNQMSYYAADKVNRFYKADGTCRFCGCSSDSHTLPAAK